MYECKIVKITDTDIATCYVFVNVWLSDQVPLARYNSVEQRLGGAD